jgi:hypothetical protein
MGFFIPFTRIWAWLESQYYHFITDDSVSYEQCEKERSKAQEDARRVIDVLSAQRSTLGNER